MTDWTVTSWAVSKIISLFLQVILQVRLKHLENKKVGKWFQARWFLAALVILDLSCRTNGYIICDPGYILVDDNCTMCGAGKYKQDSGNIPCRSCSVNSDSPAGTTAQVQVQRGLLRRHISRKSSLYGLFCGQEHDGQWTCTCSSCPLYLTHR